MRITSVAIIAALFGLVILPFVAKNAYSHSAGPVIVYPQSYYMQPGQTLTQDTRICLLTGDEFTVSNITFKGNYSTWAKVDEGFPMRAAAAADGASGIDIPVTITVPTNFTEKHALIQAIVEVPAAADASPGMAGIPIFIRDSTTTQQNLPDCNSFRDIQRSISYGIIILVSVGGALAALGYFIYRRSKKKSKDNRASRLAKVSSIFFIIIGSLLLLAGLFLFVVQIL